VSHRPLLPLQNRRRGTEFGTNRLSTQFEGDAAEVALLNTIGLVARGARKFRIFVPLVLLIAGSTPLLAQAPSLSDRLPANTVFFAYWHGMGEVTRAEKTNHVVQLFEDPDFVRARAAVLKSLRDNIAKNGPATSEREQIEVLSLFDNPAVVGVVLNPDPGKKPASSDAAQPPATGFFVVYDANGKTAIVEKLRAANRATGKEVPTVMSYNFQGTKIEARATGTDVSYTALTPKYYFLADQKPVIEELIARFSSAEKPANSITQLPEYESIRPFVGADSAVEFFARFPKLTRILTPAQLEKPAAKFAENLRLDRIHVFGGSVSFAGEATRFHGAMLGDATAGGLFDFAGASGASFVTEPAVSAGPIFSISRFNFVAIYQMLRAAAQPLFTSQQAAAVDMYEKMAQGFLGMPVTDALQLFSGEVASETSFADDGLSLRTYAISIQKPQDVLRILRAAAGSFIVGEDTSGNTTYVDLAYPYTDPKTGIKRREFYYVAVTPTMLFVAPRKALIRQAMSRLNAKADAAAAPATGILGSGELAHERSLLPEKLSGLSAVDIVQIPWDKVAAHYSREIAEAAKDSTTPPPSFDWLQTVKPEVVTRHVHSGISGWWKDSHGIYFDSYIQ
jgi:hypothetical protein